MAIPHTRTRLKGYVTLFTQRGGNELADIEVQNLEQDDMIIIGAAQQLIINQERETNGMRREFNPAYSGKPSETYPGLPNYSITLQRVDLYDKNLSEAFGLVGSNIVDQYKPLLIRADQPVPVDDNNNPLSIGGSEFKETSYIIPGCWFNGLPVEYNIDDADQKYVVQVDMIARDVIVRR